jgi:hypothetical protein
MGMARRADDFIIVLDMNRVFASDELLTLAAEHEPALADVVAPGPA